MEGERARFVDAGGEFTPDNEQWRPVVIRSDEIAAEVERLAALAEPPAGRREARIVHPLAGERALGLAPGIEVRLCVLRPGERTAPLRTNATEVHFCIGGEGRAQVADRALAFARYDVWNQPGWTPATQANTGDETQVRLVYSNAPLLRMLNVYRVDESPPQPEARSVEAPSSDTPTAAAEPDAAASNPFGTFPVGEGGDARLMPYERLIDPPAVASPALHWPWVEVREQLDKLTALGSRYRGRRLYLLYNPMTGRTNGTTPSFFATMTVRPPGIVDRPHRHVSAAINYYFSGAGFSRVAGERYDWAAGDLMLSAPGWAIHNHASKDEGPVYELTIQDQPFHIGMESLLWQEELSQEAALLGVDRGFATNRDEVSS